MRRIRHGASGRCAEHEGKRKTEKTDSAEHGNALRTAEGGSAALPTIDQRQLKLSCPLWLIEAA